MKNEIVVDNVKFWLEQNIIHCKFNNKFDKRYLENEIESLFVEAISMLSDGIYRPILFDLTNIHSFKALCIFKFLSRNEKIQLAVLSKSFLIKSIETKLLLELCSLSCKSVVPNRIFTKYSSMVKYSHVVYNEFNASF